MTLELVLPNHPALTTPTAPFDFENPPVDPNELALEMVQALRDLKGAVGLAANQFGLPYRVFAMRAETPFVCFNPRIVLPGDEQIELEEGCITMPGLVVKVKRPRHVKVRFQTPSGATTTQTFTGMTARCFLHEMDHLNGKFFFEGIGRLKMESALKKAKKAGFDYAGLNLMKHAINRA